MKWQYSEKQKVINRGEGKGKEKGGKKEKGTVEISYQS